MRKVGIVVLLTTVVASFIGSSMSKRGKNFNQFQELIDFERYFIENIGNDLLIRIN